MGAQNVKKKNKKKNSVYQAIIEYRAGATRAIERDVLLQSLGALHTARLKRLDFTVQPNRGSIWYRHAGSTSSYHTNNKTNAGHEEKKGLRTGRQDAINGKAARTMPRRTARGNHPTESTEAIRYRQIYSSIYRSNCDMPRGFASTNLAG